ncbi:TetR/AcrR family transcriptional regulator [Paenibacillus solisilvae]|uniref:TetR/AcrR family transcriptional regulator n=1 Tax=Paenibacillus solisilvae TaxID=2486751 RepID=A0ABW0VYV0_9BACL
MFERYNKVQRAVLETTLRIINQKELQATSMSLIAKESKVSTGSIYHYFQSKEDIINELYKAIVTFTGDVVMKDIDANQPVQARFRRVWENIIGVSMKHPEGFQFIEQYSFSPYIYEESKLEAYKVGWCNPVEKLYSEAIEQKLFIDMEPKLLVQMHYGSIVYLVKADLQKYIELTEDAVQHVITSAWKSVLRS